MLGFKVPRRGVGRARRPGAAKGVVFMTREDETVIGNVVVWKDTFEAHRKTVMSAAFRIVHGQAQRAGEVIHLAAADCEDLTGRPSELREHRREIKAYSRVDGRRIRSRDFHG